MPHIMGTPHWYVLESTDNNGSSDDAMPWEVGPVRQKIFGPPPPPLVLMGPQGVETGKKKSTNFFSSEADAIKYAKDMAAKNVGNRYYVLKSTHGFLADNLSVHKKEYT